MTTTKIDKLAAVNSALVAIGSSPVSSLLGALPRDASVALFLFDLVDIEAQATGWWFNTDHDVQVLPDSNGFLNVPQDALSIDVDASAFGSASRDLVPRNGRLFDRDRNSDVFTDPVRVEVVRRLDFDGTPPSFQAYVAALLAVRLQQDVLGDTSKNAFLQGRLDMAWAGVLRDEFAQSDQTHLDNELGFFAVGLRRRGRFRFTSG